MDFDTIAGAYSGASALPIRAHVESYTFLGVLGDVAGEAALDVACGDGTYARVLRRMGAARVVGVDVSKEMIRAARAIEERSRAGVEYVVADARLLPVLGTFDVVTAVYLLHYAASREDLRRMCRGIADNLRSGGRFVALVMNPAFDVERASYEKYGFVVRRPESPRDGDPTSILFHTEPPFTIHFHHWSRAAYEDALRSAGFDDIAWTSLALSPEGEARFGMAFWQDCIDNPYAMVVSCRRSEGMQRA